MEHLLAGSTSPTCKPTASRSPHPSELCFCGVKSTGCFIADSWADYQTPFLPTITGPYTGPLYGNFAALSNSSSCIPNLKVLISLAGADGFSAAAATAAGRQAFVSSCIDLLSNGNVAPDFAAGVFDGIDVDWEFPRLPTNRMSRCSCANSASISRRSDEQSSALPVDDVRAAANRISRTSNCQGRTHPRFLQRAGVRLSRHLGNVHQSRLPAVRQCAGSARPTTSISIHGQRLLESRRSRAQGGAGIPLYGRGWTGVPKSITVYIRRQPPQLHSIPRTTCRPRVSRRT